MSSNPSLKGKLGLNVFKEGGKFHIRIREGKEKDPRLAKAVVVCPAGLYSQDPKGGITLSSDGCLECGSCLIACGRELLEWEYPEAGTGVQFRFG